MARSCTRIAELFRRHTPITEALNSAVRETVRRHKQAGRPLVVWREGRTMLIPPELIPDYGAEQPIADDRRPDSFESSCGWGDYRYQPPEGAQGGPIRWKRTDREEVVGLDVPDQTKQPIERGVPASNGLKVVLSVRPLFWICRRFTLYMFAILPKVERPPFVRLPFCASPLLCVRRMKNPRRVRRGLGL